jgi:hypothetical protein
MVAEVEGWGGVEGRWERRVKRSRWRHGAQRGGLAKRARGRRQQARAARRQSRQAGSDCAAHAAAATVAVAPRAASPHPPSAAQSACAAAAPPASPTATARRSTRLRSGCIIQPGRLSLGQHCGPCLLHDARSSRSRRCCVGAARQFGDGAKAARHPCGSSPQQRSRARRRAGCTSASRAAAVPGAARQARRHASSVCAACRVLSAAFLRRGRRHGLCSSRTRGLPAAGWRCCWLRAAWATRPPAALPLRRAARRAALPAPPAPGPFPPPTVSPSLSECPARCVAAVPPSQPAVVREDTLVVQKQSACAARPPAPWRRR